jgi:hypothetical protein
MGRIRSDRSTRIESTTKYSSAVLLAAPIHETRPISLEWPSESDFLAVARRSFAFRDAFRARKRATFQLAGRRDAPRVGNRTQSVFREPRSSLRGSIMRIAFPAIHPDE